MKIRKAKINEWSNLQDLNNEVFLDNAKYDPDIIIDWAYSEAGEKYFKELVNDQKSLCIVAETDFGELVGYLAASPKEFGYRKSKYLEVDNMGVIPEYRSKGLGRELMDKAIEWAKENGFQKVYVCSYSENDKAIKFYEKCGYKKIDVSLEREV
jgi:ribosomal protein S18 acetylase RimI-like enzyme